MLRNYLRTGFRNLSRSPAASLINVVGLSAAVGGAIALFLFILALNANDDFHVHGDELYLVGHSEENPGHTVRRGTAPAPLGPRLAAEFPEVVGSVRIAERRGQINVGSAAFRETITLADPGFFELLTFPLARGSTSSLSDPGSVIFSSGLAAKVFGEEDPVGRDLELSLENGETRVVTVRGVAQPFPSTASFSFDVLTAFDRSEAEDWTRHVNATFVRLAAGADPEALAARMQGYVDEANAAEATSPGMSPASAPIASFFLDNVGRPHWWTAWQIENRALQAPRVPESIMFGVIGLLILLVACFNYITIALGAAAKRLKEIGVRKSTGASRRQIIVQFLTENFVLCGLALMGGLVFAWTTTIPFLDGVVSVDIPMEPLTSIPFLVFLVGLFAFLGLVSGAYPAMHVSSFRPAEILRGRRTLAEKKRLTRTLTTAQFVLTIITISFASFAGSLDSKLLEGDWGYDASSVIVLPVTNAEHHARLSEEIAGLSPVQSLAGAADHVGATLGRVVISVDAENVEAFRYGVGPGYLETMGLRLVSGRLFGTESGANDVSSAVVNHTFAARYLGEETVGSIIQIGDRRATVVGVVEDVLIDPYLGRQKPVVFDLAGPDSFESLAVRVEDGQERRAALMIEGLWRQTFPGLDFDHYEQEEVFSPQSLRGVSRFTSVVALFALMVSCMGLFGLASQRAARRRKEVGIRKTLGASFSHILFVVNREYVVMLTIATLIATPLCVLAFSNSLLRYTATDITVGWTPFIVANVVIFVTAALSIALQTRNLLRVPPAEALRLD